MPKIHKKGKEEHKIHRKNETMKEGYPVVVDAKDDMTNPVKGLPKGRA